MVNFGDCLVRSEGAIALAAVLREGLPIVKVSSPLTLRPWRKHPRSHRSAATPSFQDVNLSFGEITMEAALVVAQAVRDKPHMERLDLNGTHTVEIVDDTQGSGAVGRRRFCRSEDGAIMTMAK